MLQGFGSLRETLETAVEEPQINRPPADDGSNSGSDTGDSGTPGSKEEAKGEQSPRANGGESSRPSRGPKEVVAAFEGEGPETTPVFGVKGPWSIAWGGPDVFFFLKDVRGVLVHGDGGTEAGSYTVRRSGRFYLDVVARGEWTIRIVR